MLPAGATITLTVGDNGSGPDINGLPPITSNITINGNNAIIERSSDVGTPNFRVFEVTSTGTLTLNDVTVRNGKTSLAATGRSGYGEAIEVGNNGILTVNNCTFSGNSTGDASGWGGGIMAEYGATVTVMNSTISGNSAGSNGGGIALNGAGLTVTNSTISGNTTSASGSGGGIFDNLGTGNLTNCTVTGNTAATGGGIYFGGTTPVLTLRNTIVAMNNATSKPNCSGSIVHGGNNVDTGTSCGWGSTNGSMSGVDPLLGPLADNGGPTWTRALQAGSRAINGVTHLAPNGSPSTDQRGFPRLQGTLHDIGAFELVQQLFLPLILRDH